MWCDLIFRPFGQCYELLTQKTVTEYLLPIIEAVPKFLDSLNDDDLKKEAKNESKNDAVSAIIKSLKSLASCVPSQEENIRQLEMFRLKMILRQLQISSLFACWLFLIVNPAGLQISSAAHTNSSVKNCK